VKETSFTGGGCQEAEQEGGCVPSGGKSDQKSVDPQKKSIENNGEGRSTWLPWVVGGEKKKGFEKI